MRAKSMLFRSVQLLLLAASFTLLTQTINAEENSSDVNDTITATASLPRGSYTIGQPVPIEIAITNNGQEPVYIYVDEFGYLGLGVTVEDVNGNKVEHGPVPSPPPRHWWITIDGKKIFTHPVVEIEPGQTTKVTIQDALNLYHGYLQEGVYYVTPRELPVIHEVDSIIVREDQEHKLWIQPSAVISRARYEVNNKVKITLYQGKIIYVDDDGPADFNTIQAAIDDANDGDTVLVAPGTYTGDGNRDIDFKGKAITVKSENGPESCIIQCGGRYPVGDQPYQIEPEYHRGFYFHTYEDANSIVQGLTVTQAYMDTEDGGAILCIDSSPIIKDCIIRGNFARNGGGIAAYRSDVQIENCVISRNIASDFPWKWFHHTTFLCRGGGISVAGGNAQLQNCLVVGNAASKEGGGIWCSHGNYQIINCTVSGNRTGEWGHGGGILFGLTGTSLVKNSVLWQNRAESLGNEIRFQVGREPTMRIQVTNSLIGKEPNDISMFYDTLWGQWLTEDPLFSNAGHWDPNGTLEDASDDFWVDGDYHMKSLAGRWDPNSGSWVVDDMTSPCIDVGDPNMPVGDEPEPNGGRINIGAYGGTPEASKSYILVKIIYVDDDAVGLNDGSSWKDAYTFLQDALVDANSVDKPVEIRVAQGIYKPDQGTGQTPGDREATFQLINDVKLTGSYAGLGQYDPNARDIELYQTILSGDLDGNDVDVNTPYDLLEEPTRAENSYHVVTGSNTNETAILDGFIITAGNANSFPSYLRGSGMCNYQNSNPTLTNCIFKSNTASSGGGMYNRYSNPALINCKFNGNAATFSGGGMFNLSSNLTLTDCTLSENSTGSSGGGVCNYYSNPAVIRCTFNGNLARNDGGGVYNRYSNPVFTDCVFSGNVAKYYDGGGMINHYSSNPALTGCTFNGNTAKDDGGGMYNYYTSNPTLTNCIFSGNLADYGGAISNRGSHDSITNCTFKINRAGDFGGGIYISGGKSIITNCLFYFNSGKNGNALACSSSSHPSSIELNNCILWGDYYEIWNSDYSTITIAYCNIKGGQNNVYDPNNKNIWGEGNIDSDPCFVSPGYWADANDPNIVVEPNNTNAVWIEGDYHLKSQAGRWDPNSRSWIKDDITSFCIDAGNPMSPVGYESFPNGGRINMGAFGGTQQASMSLFDVNTFKPALVPNPADGAVDVSLEVMPGWISDPNVIMHDIYFGTSELPPFIRQQSQREFDPGVLKPNTKYYWRVDDIDNLLNRVIGNVWTFMTGPKPAYAYNSIPFNGIDDVVAYRAILTWYPGLYAVSHNVYLGTDFNNVYQATTVNRLDALVSVAQEPNFFNPDILEFEQSYYWRIDEIDDQDVITPGNIWTFTTGSQPDHSYNPNPSDGAIGVSPEIVLSWSPGKNAVAHDVYFGIAYPPKFLRNQIETDFNPGQLYPQGMLPTQADCYWRIDEIDIHGNIILGETWRFKVHEYKGRICFTGQTPVWIDDSFIPISKVDIGQSIDGINRIEEVQEHEGTYTLYDILLESGNSITVAENHFFMTEADNWLSLHNLKAGMRLKTLNGSIGIQRITKQPSPFTGKVYNLKIQGSDQYMVGKDMVIVRDY